MHKVGKQSTELWVSEEVEVWNGNGDPLELHMVNMTLVYRVGMIPTGGQAFMSGITVQVVGKFHNVRNYLISEHTQGDEFGVVEADAKLGCPWALTLWALINAEAATSDNTLSLVKAYVAANPMLKGSQLIAATSTEN